MTNPIDQAKIDDAIDGLKNIASPAVWHNSDFKVLDAAIFYWLKEHAITILTALQSLKEREAVDVEELKCLIILQNESMPDNWDDCIEYLAANYTITKKDS